jgi:hypothetical protein
MDKFNYACFEGRSAGGYESPYVLNTTRCSERMIVPVNVIFVYREFNIANEGTIFYFITQLDILW